MIRILLSEALKSLFMSLGLPTVSAAHGMKVVITDNGDDHHHGDDDDEDDEIIQNFTKKGQI